MSTPDTGSLEGRVAIVTGAGQGAGRGSALALAARGVQVVLFGRTAAKLEAVAAEIAGRGGAAVTVAGDVTRAADRAALIDAAVARFGALHILVNAAQSPEQRDGPLDLVSDDVIEELWQSGFAATLDLMKRARPHMAASGHGSIINFGTGAQVNPAGFGIYAGIKAAVATMSRAAAVEWGAQGIRVNVVYPYVASPSSAAHAAADPATIQALTARMPIQRLGDPELDIGRAVAFLAGPESSYVTGTTLPLNGGLAYLR